MQYFARSGDTVVQASSDYLLLSAYAVVRTNSNLTLLVINKDTGNSFTGQITLNGFTPVPTAIIQSYGMPQDNAARTGIGSQDIVSANTSSVSTNFSYSLPPLSLTLFTFTAQPRLNQPLIIGDTNLILNWSGGGTLQLEPLTCWDHGF